MKHKFRCPKCDQLINEKQDRGSWRFFGRSRMLACSPCSKKLPSQKIMYADARETKLVRGRS